MDISNATERRHSPEIAAHAQKHRQQNLEKPAADAQDKPATNGQIKEDTVEISEEGRLAQQSQGLLKQGSEPGPQIEAGPQIEPGPQADNLLAKVKEMRRTQIEERKQEAEANGDDFLKKMVNGDYGFGKYDRTILNEILSDEQLTKLDQLYEQKRADEKALIVKITIPDTSSAEHFIYNALNGKVENALDIAVQLGNMVFASNPSGTDLETRTADREAGRDLAKYIAKNYFDNPKEAQAFMDKINKYIKNSELRDQGYITYSAEMEPMKPQPPGSGSLGDLTQWFIKKGYNPEEIGPSMPGFYNLVNEFAKEKEAHSKIYGQTPAKQWNEKPSWEECKAMDCDPKYSMFFKENRAWYSDFLEKMNSAQKAISNAKLMITDFSSNEKWNVVMNLLS